ncbi:MAG: hypothetical protein KC492_24950 [Myxococcales bacterium]|nr:hypothetical protein [Myxococcales bacterium]
MLLPDSLPRPDEIQDHVELRAYTERGREIVDLYANGTIWRWRLRSRAESDAVVALLTELYRTWSYASSRGCAK